MMILSSMTDWVKGNSAYRGVESNLSFMFYLALFTIFAIWLGERIIDLLIKRSLKPNDDSSQERAEAKKRARTVLTVSRAIWKLFVVVVAASAVVARFNLPSGPITAAMGAVGVAIGFGARELVQDIINGVFIISENQFKIGDYISVASSGQTYGGTVENITMRRTTLRDICGEVHHIPNSAIRVATNKTSGFSKMVVRLNLDKSTDIEKLEKVIDAAGEKFHKETAWARKLKEEPYMARVTNLDEGDISVIIWARTVPGNQWQAASEFRKRLKADLDKNNIDLS